MPFLRYGIDAGDQVRPADVARVAAARRVDDRGAARRGRAEDGAAAVAIDDVGPRDQHVDGQAAAAVEDRADLPVPEDRVAQRAQVLLLARPDGQRVDGADVVGVADVEVVVAVVVVEVTDGARVVADGLRFVRAAELPKLFDSVYCAFRVSPWLERRVSESCMAL